MNNPLDYIYKVCDPFLPAPDEFYYDCREARGGDAFINYVFKHIDRSKTTEDSSPQRYRHFLFSGHIGSGKSSELKHLVKKFQEKPDVKYFPIYIDTFNYLDVYDVTITDILLSIVTELAETLREELELEIDLQDKYFNKKLNEIKDLLLTDLEITEGTLKLGTAKVKIQRLKQDPDNRKRVRDALRPNLPTILEEANLLFQRARLEIRKKMVGETSLKYSDIIIIVDNLEKIQRFDENKEGLESYEKLFIDNYPQLTGLQSHIIFTVPLRLIRSAIAPKLREYYSEPFVLPMVKIVHRKNREPFEKGITALKTILQKRFGDINVDDAFEPDALDFLLKYSGGSIRSLMMFVREASAYADELPMKIGDARNAIKKTIPIFSEAIPDRHWELLAKLDLSKDQRFPNDDEDYRKMLENLSVLEYINGGDEDIWEEVVPWYAVNPIVRELRQFKEAKERIQKVQSRITE